MLHVDVKKLSACSAFFFSFFSERAFKFGEFGARVA